MSLYTQSEHPEVVDEQAAATVFHRWTVFNTDTKNFEETAKYLLEALINHDCWGICVQEKIFIEREPVYVEKSIYYNLTNIAANTKADAEQMGILTAIRSNNDILKHILRGLVWNQRLYIDMHGLADVYVTQVPDTSMTPFGGKFVIATIERIQKSKDNMVE